MTDVDGSSGPLRYTTAAAVGPEHSRATWALAARERLVDAAGHYQQVVTAQELADFVQRRSLIRTPQRPQYWIGDVLGRVATACAERGEPLLSALCVDARGHVAAGYAATVEGLTGTAPDDPDEHAAHERLACHRHFGADLPPGGGEPVRLQRPLPPAPARKATTSTRRPAASGDGTARRPAPVDKPLVTCPVHFTVLPASGICDLCD